MIGFGLSITLIATQRRGDALPAPQFAWLSDAGVTGNPVSSWASGATTLDQGTSANRPSVTASVFGSTQGIVFDGANDLLSSSAKVITTTGAATLSVVFRTPATITNQVLVSQSNTAAANDWWEIGIAADGRIYAENNNAGTVHNVRGSSVLDASTNYHVMLVYDGTDFWMSLNGVEENPLTIESTGAFAWLGRVGGSAVLSVGATVTSGGAQRLFSGALGAVYFWDRDLTA